FIASQAPLNRGISVNDGFVAGLASIGINGILRPCASNAGVMARFADPISTTSLKSLELQSLKRINSGAVVILENKNLCFAEDIKWNKVKKSTDHDFVVSANRNKTECEIEDQVCSDQCTLTGCWGAGPNQCLECRSYKYNDTCLASCKSLPGDILSGSVGIFNNYNLCHMRTIDWEEIISGPNASMHYMYNFTSPERQCVPCHPSCQAGCWGEGPHNCQQFSKTTCSPQCAQGRCFGPKPRECCHLFCAGGCSGPTQKDCLACRNFYDDGVCKQECPPMQKYNPTNYLWEPNPDGKYAYGATCVRNCPEHLLKDNGACVRTCPPNKMAKNGECVPCNGACPKTCPGQGIVHSGNIDSFRGCTVIEGSLEILEQTFNGYQHVFANFSFGQRFIRLHPDRLEVFSTLKEVTGYINIQADHEHFTNLSYFRNLEVIGGRQLMENYFASLYIVKVRIDSFA
uniref:receptor protein-tyrosine kinase n=1 Tax=Phlebotomus papatasi TaxID=29031 RepID=A0A1B0DKW0_PHLPP